MSEWAEILGTFVYPGLVASLSALAWIAYSEWRVSGERLLLVVVVLAVAEALAFAGIAGMSGKYALLTREQAAPFVRAANLVALLALDYLLAAYVMNLWRFHRNGKR